MSNGFRNQRDPLPRLETEQRPRTSVGSGRCESGKLWNGVKAQRIKLALLVRLGAEAGDGEPGFDECWHGGLLFRRQCDQRVSAGHAQRLEVFEVAGQQEQTRVLSQGRNRDIGKTGVAALRDGGI